MIKSLPVHMFWQSGDFSRLARLSLASFRRHGFRVTLWSYEPDAHAMSGAGVRDRASLCRMVWTRKCRWPYLSSLLRHRAFANIGGMWADMDWVALSDSRIVAAPLIASEYQCGAGKRTDPDIHLPAAQIPSRSRAASLPGAQPLRRARAAGMELAERRAEPDCPADRRG